MAGKKVPFRGFRGKRIFGTTPTGEVVTEYTLTNLHGLEMKVIDYGCTITSLNVPDRNGVMGDIVLGYDTLEGYLQSDAYLGCVVGRFANRIAHGKFLLEGKEYTLATNLPPHHLHGGAKNFSKTIWTAEEVNDEESVGIKFTHLSPDGDEGYPGNLQLEVKYILRDDNTLSFEYRATTDQATIINLTQHTYFNLNSAEGNILGHTLKIDADHFLPADETMIPTGEKRKVEGTPFDFRSPKTVGLDIDADDSQLIIGHGYDHCFVLRDGADALRHAAALGDTESGRRMEVYTTEPGVQLYTANFLNSVMPGKNNFAQTPRSGLCLETQHFPDSPNHAEFPSVTLNVGENFYSKTMLIFSIR